MSRKISKTSLVKHNKLLNELFKEFKIEPLPAESVMGYTHSMQTKYGLLLVRPDSQVGHSVYTVFTRFDDPTKLPKELESITPCTTYTGKMNFHFADGEFCVGSMRRVLKLIKLETT